MGLLHDGDQHDWSSATGRNPSGVRREGWRVDDGRADHESERDRQARDFSLQRLESRLPAGGDVRSVGRCDEQYGRAGVRIQSHEFRQRGRRFFCTAWVGCGRRGEGRGQQVSNQVSK